MIRTVLLLLAGALFGVGLVNTGDWLTFALLVVWFAFVVRLFDEERERDQRKARRARVRG